MPTVSSGHSSSELDQDKGAGSINSFYSQSGYKKMDLHLIFGIKRLSMLHIGVYTLITLSCLVLASSSSSPGLVTIVDPDSNSNLTKMDEGAGRPLTTNHLETAPSGTATGRPKLQNTGFLGKSNSETETLRLHVEDQRNLKQSSWEKSPSRKHKGRGRMLSSRGRISPPASRSHVPSTGGSPAPGAAPAPRAPAAPAPP